MTEPAADRPADFRHVVATRATGPAPPEPELVIEHREELVYMICEAAELEHSLMCEYLFAAFSLKAGAADGLTAAQAAMVQRWRAELVGVATEEMLHLALTANLLSAIGAAPHVTRPNLPQPAHQYPPGVTITLLPFGEQALRHFLFLERPEGMALEDAEGIAVLGQASPVLSADDVVPRRQDFATVGHLYRSIEAGFVRLSETTGEPALFIGPPGSQTGPAAFGVPGLRAVTDLPSARQAIETIVAQGEGLAGEWRHGHFSRFATLLEEFLAARRADPTFQPARPVMAAGVRPRAPGVPGITDPVTAAVADLGNVVYESLLLVLHRLFARIDESEEQARALADVAVAIMRDLMVPIATALTELPVGAAWPGATAGLTFELFYRTDYLLPHHGAAWRIYAERLRQVAALARRLADRVPVLDAVAPVADRLADRLAEA